MGVIVGGITVAVGFMLWAAGAVSNFVDRHPTVKILALSFLLLIGVALVADPARPQRSYVSTTLLESLTEAAEQRLSTWRDDSELAVLNRMPVGESFEPSPALAADLERGAGQHLRGLTTFPPPAALAQHPKAVEATRVCTRRCAESQRVQVSFPGQSQGHVMGRNKGRSAPGMDHLATIFAAQ